MNQSRSRSTNHILHLTQSPLICPTPNLSHTTLHLTLRHLPYLSLNLFLKYITPNLNPYITPNLNPCITPSLSRQFITHLILSPLLLTIHPTLNLTQSPLLSTIHLQPTLNPNPSIINHIQNHTILPSLNHIIPLSLSITLHSPSTTHPHPSRSHTTLRTNPMLTLSPHPTLNIIMATTHSPTLHLLRTEHLLHHLNLHQRSQQLLRQLQLQQPQILLLAILLLDNCMQLS